MNGRERVEFRILGALEVIGPQGPVTLGGAKRRGLLALLVVRAGQVVSLDCLVDSLWCEQLSKGARGTVQTYLSQLRKLFAASDAVTLETHPGGYVLQAATRCIDAARFEQLCAQAVAEPDTCRRLQVVDEALALWRGPPLGEFAGAEWADLEATRLEALHLQALQRRIDALLDLGRHAEVIPELEHLTGGEHRLDEHFWAQLMLAYYRAGRQADALRAYQDVRSTLADELGIEPGAELVDLERAILDHDATLDRPRILAGAPDGRRAIGDMTEFTSAARTNIFVGRGRELAEIWGALESTLAGRGTVALISGEPGIGKTRLSEQIGTLATERGARVLWGRCFEGGGAPAYWPLLQVLRAYVEERQPSQLAAELGKEAGELARLLPELRDFLPGVEVPDLDDEGARFRMFDAVYRMLGRAASRQPLILVFDDLHWADRSTLLFLEFAAPLLAAVPVLVIGAYRNVDIGTEHPLLATVGELARAPSAVSIELGGLEVTDIAACVAHATGSEPDQQVVAALAARTEGNPFFVNELVRLLALDGGIDQTAATRRLPETVRAAIARRLDRLAPDAREVLSAAAVVGRDFNHRILQLSTESGAVQIDDCLDAARSSHVIERSGHDSYRFVHALVREVLYDEQPPRQRAQLHRRAAEALDGLMPDEPEKLEEVAHHWFHGARPEDAPQAVDACMRAGGQAESLLAHGEAALHYEHAFSLMTLERDVDPRRQYEVLFALGRARMRGGHLGGARAALAAAGQLAKEAADGPRVAAAALTYHGPPWIVAVDAVELSLLEAALTLNQDRNAPALRARLHAQLSVALPDGSEDKRHHSEKALQLARKSQDPAALHAALSARFWTRFIPGAIAEQLRTADDAVAAARLTKSLDLVAQASILRLLALYLSGQVDAARSAVEELTTVAETMKEPFYVRYAAVDRARRLLAAGDLDGAEAAATASLNTTSPDIGDDSGVFRGAQAQLVSIRLWQGRGGELVPLIRDLIMSDAVAGSVGNALRLALLRALLQADSIDEARTEWERFANADFAALTPVGGWARLMELALSALVCCRLGDVPRAAVLHRLLVSWEGAQVQAHIPVYLGPVNQFLGMIEYLLGRHGAAISHLEDALAFTDRIGAEAHSAEIRCELARVLLTRDASGDRQHADSLLEHASRVSAACGLMRVLEDCEQLTLHRASPAPPLSLTNHDPKKPALTLRDPVRSSRNGSAAVD
jgi:DNA-binding SARP family transcriptional activator